MKTNAYANLLNKLGTNNNKKLSDNDGDDDDEELVRINERFETFFNLQFILLEKRK
jgi:hypothetical protein